MHFKYMPAPKPSTVYDQHIRNNNCMYTFLNFFTPSCPRNVQPWQAHTLRAGLASTSRWFSSAIGRCFFDRRLFDRPLHHKCRPGHSSRLR